jgi:hypothetical protein
VAEWRKPGYALRPLNGVLRVQARALVFLSLAVSLASCAPPPKPPPPPPPPLPPHLGPPPAASCTVAPFRVADGGTAKVAMTLSNEGGYCAATLTAESGKPFDAPLLHTPPAHGSARVVKYNGHTSVEYTPVAGFIGTDSFEVRLIVKGKPGYTTLVVSAAAVAGKPGA